MNNSCLYIEGLEYLAFAAQVPIIAIIDVFIEKEGFLPRKKKFMQLQKIWTRDFIQKRFVKYIPMYFAVMMIG